MIFDEWARQITNRILRLIDLMKWQTGHVLLLEKQDTGPLDSLYFPGTIMCAGIAVSLCMEMF